MALDELKVKQIPAAFAAQAQLHNALVDLIDKMRGTSGIIVQVTGGGIVVSLNPTALQGLNTGSGGGGNANVGGTVQAVGPNGVLVDVVQPVTPNTPNTYPNYLRVNEPGVPLGNTAYMEPGNVTIWNVTSNRRTEHLIGESFFKNGAGTEQTNVSPNTVKVTTSGATTTVNANGIAIQGSTLDFKHNPVSGLGGWYAANKIEIDAGLLTANMAIREWTGCNSGSPGNYLAITSDFF